MEKLVRFAASSVEHAQCCLRVLGLVRVELVAEGPSPSLPRLLQTQVTVLGLPEFENAKFKICGRPDGLVAADGALYPIEVKSHKDVQRTDELELAFYWMLLEPRRTRTVEPVGYLILRGHGRADMVEVPIRPHRFDEVQRLLQEVRDARRRGVQPQICGCNVCSRVKREDVLRSTQARKDLTLIWGIARARARHLSEFGISTYEDLLGCDGPAVVAWLRERKDFVSEAMVDQWRHHARSYVDGAPALFGDPLPIDVSFIALDLEYIPGLVWLAGVLVVEDDPREHLALWADTPAQEKRNLKRLGELFADYPSLPVIMVGRYGGPA